MPLRQMEVDLPVAFRGQTHPIAARWIRIGYGFRWVIPIDGVDYVFERDEERNYRMIGGVENANSLPDREWVEAIIRALESLSAE